MKKWIEVSEQNQRQIGMAPELLHHTQNPRQGNSIFQGALRRPLNRRSIRRRIRERNSQLDAVRSPFFQSPENLERGIEIRISRRDERNQRSLSAFFQCGKFCLNPTHDSMTRSKVPEFKVWLFSHYLEH